MVLVWFKRDLRLLDHEPLVKAIATGKKILLLYSFEPLWTNDEHYGEKHINFIKESLEDLQRQLHSHNTQILVVAEDILSVFQKLHDFEAITQIFSYQETGMKITYDRDKNVSHWCRSNTITWEESIQNGVFRGIKNRKKWKNDWVTFINSNIDKPRMELGHFYSIDDIDQLSKINFTSVSLDTKSNPHLQKGGTRYAVKYLRLLFKRTHLWL